MTAAGHTRRRIAHDGAPLEEADGVALLVHGRGGSAAGMLELAREVAPSHVALLAPQADRNTWYPRSFLSPIEENEPWLSSALEWFEEIVGGLVDEDGFPSSSLAFVGFSQGACLSLEYVARHPRKYGGVAALSGGLIGPPDHAWSYEGSLYETPIFLGCSDRDPHIPEERVHESAELLAALEADVTTEIYPGMGHTVNEDEAERVRTMLRQLGTERSR